jgi:small nuclear ribonucleoprotein (snRNP)-like protein
LPPLPPQSLPQPDSFCAVSQLPLTLLKAAAGNAIVRAHTRATGLPVVAIRSALGSRPSRVRASTTQLVELKNGETYNGNLVSCDTWMNLHLREVICTSKARRRPVSPRVLRPAAQRQNPLALRL